MRRRFQALFAVWILAGFTGVALGDSDPEPIPLLGGTFTPRKGTLDLDESLTAKDGVYSGHAFVQLDGPLTELDERKLEKKGVRLLGHVHGRTYVATVDASVAVLKAFIPEVGAAIARVPPKSKLDPGVARWAAMHPSGAYLVRVHADVTNSTAQRAFRRLHVQARPSRRCDCWELSLSPAQVELLAELDVVRQIEPNDFAVVPFTHEVRSVTGVEALQGFVGSANSYGFSGLTGAGVTIGVLDLGVASADHRAYRDVDALGVIDSHSRYTAVGTTVRLHAAWMTGTIGGNGVDTPATCGAVWNLRGLAPKSTLFGMTVTGSEYAIFREAIVDHAADITNNSYGDESPTNAVSLALDDDAIIWGSYGGVSIPSRPAVFAIGNSGSNTTKFDTEDNGYFGVHNPQKNGLIVGGSVIDRSLTPPSSVTRWDDSSIGPTFDGRLKPDVMAPACKSYGASADDSIHSTALVQGSYSAGGAYDLTTDCGTSFSTAAVTGIASLLLEEWRVVRGPNAQPQPSTLKAALIQGATDMTGNSLGPVYHDGLGNRVTIESFEGPDFATGYGEVNAGASFSVIADQRIVEDQVSAVGETRSYRVIAAMGAPRLRVTLAWDDPPEYGMTTPTTQKLVNDLDLTINGPLESTPAPYLPWSLPLLTKPPAYDPTWIPTELRAKAGEDHTNNVEQIQITLPLPGTYEISVKANALGFAVAQPYALASDFPLAAAVDLDAFSTVLGEPVTVHNSLSPQELSRLFQESNGKSWIVVPTTLSCLTDRSCPTCSRWGKCEPVRVNLTGVPRDWKVVLLDQKGNMLDSKPRGAGSTLKLPRGPGLTTFLALKPPDKSKAPPASKERIQLVPAP